RACRLTNVHAMRIMKLLPQRRLLRAYADFERFEHRAPKESLHSVLVADEREAIFAVEDRPRRATQARAKSACLRPSAVATRPLDLREVIRADSRTRRFTRQSSETSVRRFVTKPPRSSG